jgi:5'-nucleotidase
MNILLTNDDGIEGEGFLDFAEELKSRSGHRIYTIAPDSNRSGVSNHLTIITNRLELRPYGKAGGKNDVWTCRGTPADCTRVAVMGALSVKIDAVVSGINAGSNIGTDLIYSGTAAAARQGALNGIPSIAYSLVSSPGPFLWKDAIDYAVSSLDEFLKLWTDDIFINVNIPNAAGGPKGNRITYPALRTYEDTLTFTSDAEGLIICSLGAGKVNTEKMQGTDYSAVLDGYASVSPVFIHPVARRDCCPGVPDHAGVGKRPKTEMGVLL